MNFMTKFWEEIFFTQIFFDKKYVVHKIYGHKILLTQDFLNPKICLPIFFTNPFLDAIASQEIPYIQVTYSLTYSLTHLVTELMSSSRLGFQAFQTVQSCQER